jgi:hypothetical protein
LSVSFLTDPLAVSRYCRQIVWSLCTQGIWWSKTLM